VSYPWKSCGYEQSGRRVPIVLCLLLVALLGRKEYQGKAGAEGSNRKSVVAAPALERGRPW
jgi:hypothetical protein